MRNVWMALILTGCVLGEYQTAPFEDVPQAWAAERTGRFDALAETDNPEHGIVPAVGGAHAWMGMGDRICQVRGSSGAITTDIFVDGELLDGVTLLDGGAGGWLAASHGTVLLTDAWGGVLAEYPVDGDVLAGAITDDGVYVLVATDDGCVVVHIAPDGTQTVFAVEDEACDPDTDVEATADGVLLGGGGSILDVTPVGVVPVADGSQVSADASTQTWFSGTPGHSSLEAHLSNGQVAEVALPGALVDFAARAGELIVLTADDRLVQIDGSTLQPLAIEPYTGPLGMTRVQLTDTAEGIVLNSANRVQFYALRNDRETITAPPATGGGTSTDPGSAQ
ncbi:MAG: hypothetical protein R3F61_08215 [Myxococcota bacterium]